MWVRREHVLAHQLARKARSPKDNQIKLPHGGLLCSRSNVVVLRGTILVEKFETFSDLFAAQRRNSHVGDLKVEVLYTLVYLFWVLGTRFLKGKYSRHLNMANLN
jgi:hypothetical protein